MDKKDFNELKISELQKLAKDNKEETTTDKIFNKK